LLNHLNLNLRHNLRARQRIAQTFSGVAFGWKDLNTPAVDLGIVRTAHMISVLEDQAQEAATTRERMDHHLIRGHHLHHHS
jgi:hypothetical protein